MDPNRVLLVICLTLFIVVGINASIYALIRRGDAFHQIDLFRKAASQARDPWQREDQALEELSALVAELQAGKTENGTEPAEPEMD